MNSLLNIIEKCPSSYDSHILRDFHSGDLKPPDLLHVKTPFKREETKKLIYRDCNKFYLEWFKRDLKECLGSHVEIIMTISK